MNTAELNLLMDIGQQMTREIIKKMKLDFPKLKIGEPYDGDLKDYFSEYLKTFMLDDYIFAKKEWNKKELEEVKNDLSIEATYIECFLNWLHREKGVRLKIEKVKER